ncbi:CheY-like superfamily [Akanthomyces lecanii RCEF 1005]|uniref:histidine kinase n=1 Tax=Akanthomyces lecanii RCEF 1005 TaxID=1081108 RepID=A0A168GZA9_CORDF|nr:CheY-like superfamily [Akanthomyces lecanii RCEF 1005]
MRVPIWTQLALLVSAVALLALTVVAVPIWVYVQSFVVNVETDSLALAASLYATKIDSQLQLLNTISRRTVSTRILIQQSLVNYYNANATTRDPFVPTVTDLQSALATSSFTGLLQARIYSRNQTGESPTGLISVTGSGIGTQTQNIPLPYLAPNGLPANLSDTEFGYPPSLYPNITYQTLNHPNPYIPSETAVAASAFPGVLLSDGRGLILGPLAINQTFALISLTIPIRSLQHQGFILGYLTLVAAANSFLDIQTAVGGFGSTGVALLVTPDDPSNRFTPPLSPSNKTYQPPTGSLSNYPVRLVLAPATYPGQTDRHPDEQGNWSLPFLLSRYSAIYGVYSTFNGKLNNARATTTNTNEHGYPVAVGVARPQTTLVDWAIVVEKSRGEAYSPIFILRRILIGCAFGTAGFVMLLIIPCAYFSVRPLRRLMIATEKSVTVPGYDLTYSDGEENAARSGGTLLFAFIKGLFKSIVRVYSKPRRPPAQSEIENHRRVFKIPGRVKERSHLITDEVTELTEVYNKMTDELVRQYTSLDQQVEKRTRELEISKKAAEAANESKTLFIANISHDLKTPLNGIMGICAVCIEETDIIQVDSSFSKKFGGTGLGLSICSQLAKLMGGRVTVRSSEGLGSTFSLQIPLTYIIDRVPSIRPESTRPRSRSTSADGSTTGGANGSSSERNSLSSVLAKKPDQMTTTSNIENHRNDIQPRLVGLSTPFCPPNPNQPFAPLAKSTTVVPQITSGETQAAIQELEADEVKTSGSDPANSDLLVLVADDNATNIEVLRRMLKLEKVLDVTIAKDGREAYELVKANMKRNRKFDLIFMDVQMPNLDGIQSTKLIRQMGYAAPIVALTAFSEESNRKQCMESGMNEFLAKPIRRSALKSVLAKLAAIYEEKAEENRWNRFHRAHIPDMQSE